VIVAVNEHWRRSAWENGLQPGTPAPHTEIGTNYLSVCQPDSPPASQGAVDAAQGIRAVLDGRLPSYSQDYPCHSPTQERWFTMTVMPLGQAASDGAVITHINITERKLMENQVRELAFHDTLTHLPNRRLLNDRLNQIMAAGKRTGLYGALMFLDLDNFKPLNDAHGHEVGDLLLIEAADRLKRCVREMDTVARFGGDEFVAVIAELAADKTVAAAQAGLIAEKIRACLSAPYRLSVEHAGTAATLIEHHCTASIGVTLFVSQEASQDDLLKWADTAMYEAKSAGRNAIRFKERHPA
jgi:diguanylate cyclase (GGDEF)-like protein